jgi:lipid A 3-O-deacylase
MKPGNCYIVLVIIMLLQSACSRLDRPGNKREESQPGIQRIESRFQDIPAEKIVLNISEHNFKDTSPYYLPEWPLDRLSSIPVTDQGLRMNATGNEDNVLNSTDNQLIPIFFKEGKTSEEAFFTFTFDNDIFDYTDYYYTSGISLEFHHPALSSSPVVKILPGLKYSINYYGLTLTQHLYTPLKLNKPEILVGDRPFAAYLAISHQRISLQPVARRRLQSEFTLGILGPGSLGKYSQSVIHREEPTGWKYQVENDIVLNYTIRFDQGLYSGKRAEIAVVAGGQAGTLYDNITAGLYLQAGRASDRYSSIFQTTGYETPYKKRIRYYFSLEIMNKVVLYDATMQGGMFNKSSIYTLDQERIRRYTFSGTASFGIGFGRYSLEAAQYFLTPEFQGGRHHLWFRIRNIIHLN